MANIEYASLRVARPTQSTMYVPFQVKIFQKNILLIFEYKFSKSFSEYIILKNPKKSDPPLKIMRSCINYST